jgi:hypothetical protein
MKIVLAVLLSAALGLLAGCASLGCDRPEAYAPAARYNAAAERWLAVAPFGRPETGWAVYAPHIGLETHSCCDAASPRFAADVARWQARHGLSPTGAVDPATLQALKAAWQARRPFLALRAGGVCPDPPPPSALAAADPQETLGGKTVLLRADALSAYRRMAAAARRAVPEARMDPDALKLFSGYRSPDYDAARCASEGNCDGVGRAVCSSHRTGLALDLVIDASPGRAPDSTAAEDRLRQSRSPVYRWLVANARRYGFVNYAFEPWHWEWTQTAP